MDGDPGAHRAVRRDVAAQAGRPRLRMAVSLAIAVLLHLVVLWLLREVMQPEPATTTTRIELVLVEPEPVRAPEPQPELQPEPEPPPLVARTGPAPEARAVQPPAPEPPPPASAPLPLPTEPAPPPAATTTAPAPLDAAPIRLFRRDGRMVLPDGVVDAPQAVASYIPVPREAPPWEDRPVALAYQESMFEAYWWVPKDESLAGEFFRKATVTREFRLPWGTRVRCAWVLVIGACAW